MQQRLPNRVLGIIMIVIGAGLGFWGYQKSTGFGSQISDVVTGSPSDNVMLLYISGAALAAIGLYLMTQKG